jgi:putative heme-binding domain-containing protein
MSLLKAIFSIGLAVVASYANLPAAFADGLRITPADQISLAEGFTAELVYEVPGKQQGSWVALTVDPQGRLIASDQYGGLFRIDLSSGQAQVEKLKLKILGAQGLLHAFDSLYANVNHPAFPAGIWRFTDTNGDDQYDHSEHILPLNAGGEHGPHAMIVSADQKRLLMCAGNNTNLPPQVERSRVPQVWGEDHLLGRMPDARGHNADRMAPGGFILSMNPDGSDIELVCNGFRNEYDIALNRDGELFAFDADMEWDVGTPWYRPTRINHVISGAEFGWRNGTGKWPAYYPDSFGAAVDIGPGSPTGICFGYGTNYPQKYQDALFVCDWSYGNIYAVHLQPDGSSYRGDYETFATAAPLPVTDIVVHPDGMLYFTIGGRKTDSGLYRIRYTGAADPAAEPSADEEAQRLRQLRQQLEQYHRADAPADALDVAFQNLSHSDRAIRFAARIAIEHQAVDRWRQEVLQLSDPQARILGVIALARHGNAADKPAALAALQSLDWDSLSPGQRIDLLRGYGLIGIRLGKLTEAEAKPILAQVAAGFPTGDQRVDRELSQLLVYLGDADATAKIVAELKNSPSQENQIHYAMMLRGATAGWTAELRREYFEWFNEIQSARGGMSFGGFVENIKQAAIENLPESARQDLADVLAPQPINEAPAAQQRPLVQQWTVDDLLPAVSDPSHKPDFQRGQEVFAAAQCYKCHRMGIQGGILGPDLTAAGGRFNQRDMLVSIVEPSKEISDQYGATQFLTDDGRAVVGRIINMEGKQVQVLTNMLDPSSLTYLKRDEIESTRPATTSMMPAGLLDTFTKQEVADLIAYLRAGGQPDSPIYHLTSTTAAASPAETDRPGSERQWLEFPGNPELESAPGAGKHIVLIAGDHEYRSEEAMPQLGKILSLHHGFQCTVLFPIDPESGEINPDSVTNIPGLEALQTADLMILGLRFRNLADDQMKQIVDYTEAGKPIMALRTSTHGFQIPADRKYAKYSYNNAQFDGGYGRQVLGETWINHHGQHGKQSTRGLVADADHPIATGINDGDVWGPTDVYGVRLPLSGDGHAVILGQVLAGMKFDSEPVEGAQNDPLMPIAWTRTYKGGRVFTTTMGSADDLVAEGTRRMLVNAALWCVGLENQIKPNLNVSVVGDFEPTPFGFGKFIKGRRPIDYD